MNYCQQKELGDTSWGHEYGENAGHLLAYQLSASCLIPRIRNNSQSLTRDLLEINSTFKEFYAELYTSTFPHDNTNMTLFLDNLKVPRTDVAAMDNLDKPIKL